MPDRATTRLPPNAMNKLEADYAFQLEAQKRAGEIREWWFEAVKLRLGERCWYTPDFLVITDDGGVEFHEVKGWMRDDARVKIATAASKYPCAVFRLVTRPKRRMGFKIEEVGVR